MKPWLTHALLLVALFGHIGHSYYHTHVQLPYTVVQHDHHGHTSQHQHQHNHADTAEASYKYCPLSIIEDHLVMFDHAVHVGTPATHRNIRQRIERIALYQAAGHYDTRAPPSA